MSRFRYVKGNITEITGGKVKIFCKENVETYAKLIKEDGGKGGVLIGDQPESPPVRENVFLIEGKWTDKDDKEITRTRVGNTVRFHLQTKGIPEGGQVAIQMKDYDGTIHLMYGFLPVKLYDEIGIVTTNKETGASTPFTHLTVDKEGKAVLTLNLDENLHPMIADDMGAFIELYITCTYLNEKVDLPTSQNKYLEVGFSERTLYIQPACEGYGLPEFRTASGEIIIFSMGVETEDGTAYIPQTQDGFDQMDNMTDQMKDELKSKIEDELKERFGKATDKLRHAIAIHQLKKGKLVTNAGSVHTRKKLYRKVVFNNLGEEFTIMRASNLGWRDKGELVTSRGISQLDYFSNNGIYNGIAKASKELLHVFDFVDLVSYMSGNGKPGIIPTPFPALDFVMSLLVAQASANLNEMWEGAIDALVEAAKDQGISGIHKLKLTRGGIDKRYDFTEISQEMLNQLLKGEIRTLNQLRNLKRAQEKKDEDAFYAAGDKPYTSSLKYTVLHHKEMDENRSDFVDVVDCIFI